MMIKKNMWVLFYFLLLGGVLLLATLSYTKYNDIRENHHLKYRYFTEIISQVTHSMFLQDELMLELLGIQLLEENKYKDKSESTKIFDRLLEKDPAVAGFGLVDVEGNYLGISSNIDLSKMPNLAQDKQTKYSFQEALVSKDMVLGRTYFVEGLNEWVIPLRKAIRNKNGKVMGVMATGLKIDEHMGYLNKIHLSNESSIIMIKDLNKENTMYRQYMSDKHGPSQKAIYESPVANELYTLFKNKIKEKYHISLDELKHTGRTVSIELRESWNRNVIAGVSYNKRYKLWIIVENDIANMWAAVRKILFIYFMIFTLSFVVIYQLFKYIAHFDKQKKDELLFQVLHDSLTQLPNQAYLYKNIDRWIRRLSNSFDMLFIDLDNFKNINDNFGHKVGDEILIEVAERLRSFFGKSSLIIRQGGDEFIILMKSEEKEEKERVLKDLITLISKPYMIESMEFSLGSSIGTAQYPQDAQQLESLMSLADIAMYEAKKKKNAFCIFSPEMKSKNIRKVDMEHELRSAIKNDEFWMVYQPQIEADGKIHGVEALIRWKNDKLGFVPPDQFISVAEETGLMPELGEFVIKRSLQEMKSLQTRMNISFQLSINISVRQLIDIHFLKNLLQEIKTCDFDKSLVTLEITESLFIEDVDYILHLLTNIKEEGIGVSLDDFGTGYSSLSMLRKLPINELKIDKSFVDEILHIEEDKAMVESIVSMGQNLSMDTLAEGVETKEQVDMLRSFGCDIFQGYYFSKPLARDDLIDFLEEL